MLCNKTKNIIASLMIVICFVIFFSPNLYPAANAASTANAPTFVVSRFFKIKSSIEVDGIFLNASKDRVYNFKNVKLNIKTKSDVLIKSFTFNDNNLKYINLPAGNSVKWRFILREQPSPSGSANIASLNLSSIKITCEFSYLTEFNNSFSNGIHVFYNNAEVEQKLKQPYIDKNTNIIFIPIEMLSDPSKELKCKGLRAFVKNYEKETMPQQKKKIKNPIPDYIPLNDLEKMIFPKHRIYYEQNDDYCIIIIY